MLNCNNLHHMDPDTDELQKSPTPCDGKRHLEGNLGWILNFFLAEMLPGCSDPAFRIKRQTAGAGSCFWILAWDQSLRGFLSPTVHALQNTFRMLTLWEFSCCLGTWQWQSLLRGKSCNRFRYFWCCILCSPHGLLPLPQISSSHPASTSWEFLQEFHVFPFQESQLWAVEPQLMGTPPCWSIFLFVWELSPSLCPSLHPPSRIIHGKQGLTPAPQPREVCTAPDAAGLPTPTQHQCQIHQIHHWLSLMEKDIPASFSFAFPSPKGEFTCPCFLSSLGSDPWQAAQ